ncbi:hypothetical protein OBBRIDRAFT_438788 [Obba rivulosa]|uniref:Uncharacterized protein n=1 Tax=Obba rivulosa TaxID=1052685 RepID=A0A8E2ALC9_9APHY|nr:hypothetical protein OBBRIDRAFT_438788 [Obba rivulosa]
MLKCVQCSSQGFDGVPRHIQTLIAKCMDIVRGYRDVRSHALTTHLPPQTLGSPDAKTPCFARRAPLQRLLIFVSASSKALSPRNMGKTIPVHHRLSGDNSSPEEVEMDIMTDIDLNTIHANIKAATQAIETLSRDIPKYTAIAWGLLPSGKAAALQTSINQALRATYEANQASINALFIVRMTCYLLMALTIEKLLGHHGLLSSRFTYSDVVLQILRCMAMCAEAYPQLEASAKMWNDVAALSSQFCPWTPCFIMRMGLDLTSVFCYIEDLVPESVVKVRLGDNAKHFTVLVHSICSQLEQVETCILACKAYIESPRFDSMSPLDRKHVLLWQTLDYHWQNSLRDAAMANDYHLHVRGLIPIGFATRRKMDALDFITPVILEAAGIQ